MTKLPVPFLDPADYPTVDPALLAAIQTNLDKLKIEMSSLVQTARRSGNATVTWPGGSATSDIITVAHGLSGTPTSVLATLNNQTISGFCMVEAAFDATNVYLRLQTTGFTPANTVTNPVSWEAIR